MIEKSMPVFIDTSIPFLSPLMTNGNSSGSVHTVTLESVTFGGTKKHTLYKKDAAQWNPANENYATNYTTPVPNKAWVRSPALLDPVAYTKGSTGSEVTTTVELSISPALTEPTEVTVKGKMGTYTIFQKSATLNGDSATVGPMNMLTTFANKVNGVDWPIQWHVNFDGENDISIGYSINGCFFTWGTPSVGSGEKVTAKRMHWAAYYICNDDTTITQLGNHIALGVNGWTKFGDNETENRWEPLDYVKKHDCLRGSELAEKVLLLLGVNSVGSQVSYASSDETQDPDYPSDVTFSEPPLNPGKTELLYTDNSEDPGWPWNRFEGSFRAKDGVIWKYWTWIPILAPQGAPFVGTGDNDIEKDKSARYKVLDGVRRKYGADFYQKWDGRGVKIALP